MSAGRGIIGSIDGAAAQIIHDAKAGMTCPAGDDEALSQIILKMLNQENQLEEYSKNSRDYFLNHFTIEKYVDQIEKKMGELL
jgi:glycosyltransferase involved in cell wall biosynthesis